MSEPTLRPYQQEAVSGIEANIVFGSTQICLDAPTSFGKTITISSFIKDEIAGGKSVVFMMNLTALVQQTIDTLRSMNIPFKVVAAEFDGLEFDHSAKVTVAMQQTLYARLDKTNIDCDILVIDEFHRSFETDTMIAVKKKLDPKVIVGVSATPYDEKGYALPGVDLVRTTSVRDLTEAGFLTPLKVISVKFAEDVDLSESGAGEYSEGFLNGIINNKEYNSSVAESWKKVAWDKKTIVFSTGIDHSEALAAEFRAIGATAIAYHSKLSKKDSKAYMEDFKSGKTTVLVSVNKILVGFDDPSIICGVAARPTRTRRVWQQASGRMIRLFEGKTEAILLDCAQWTKEHGFIDEPYFAPERGQPKELAKAKADASAPVVTLTLNKEEPTVVERHIVVEKLEELRRNSEKVPTLAIRDLMAIYETTSRIDQVMEVAFEINKRKNGGIYTPATLEWVLNDWYVLLEEFPEYKDRIVKMLKTLAKNKVSQGKKLNALHYSPDWVRTLTPYSYKYD